MHRIRLVLVCSLLLLPTLAWSADDVQARIFQYFLTKAKAGDANAEFIVGNRYETGNGVPQDSKKAYEWYEKAAAQGNQPAQDMLAGRKRTQEAAEQSKEDAAKKQEEAAKEKEDAAKARAEAARAAAERAQRARMQAARDAAARAAEMRAARAANIARASRTVAVTRVAQARPSTPIDAMQILLGGRWYLGQDAAQYLPSSLTSCLRAGAGQVVCFSEELSTVVGSSALTYTVKSTLDNFAQDGSFSVNYMYNVTDIRNASAGAAPAVGGPDVRLGWQTPGIDLSCKASNAAEVSCTTAQHQILQFAKR